MYYCMDMEFTSESSIPDFGTIRMYFVGNAKDGFINYSSQVKLRKYTLLSKDIGKLCLINNASDGSQALAIDTGKTYLLCDGEWREWVGNGSFGTTVKWDTI